MMEKYFLPSLAVTIVLETVVLFLALKIAVKSYQPPLTKILFAGFFTSFATLPYLWFVLPIYLRTSYYLWVGEGGVVLLETLILQQLLDISLRRALLCSFFCNAASYFLGGYLMARWTA